MRESPHWKNALLHQIEVVAATPSESPGVPGKPENHLGNSGGEIREHQREQTGGFHRWFGYETLLNVDKLSLSIEIKPTKISRKKDQTF